MSGCRSFHFIRSVVTSFPLSFPSFAGTKGKYHRRIEFRARGKTNILHKRKSHLLIELKEQPYHVGEYRIGRYGRTIQSVKVMKSVLEAFKAKQMQQAAGAAANAPTGSA